ncbi:hypothetical protein HPB47_003353 [Ixodes persulcatus]|uniref:Uncharacterized protein n=1 Tax=Ixodes persulcatus TaxID=34615 RepID=A0AC60PIR1_IXOPE|nr:hypothetical protein HPB47_003353 [Ixodes persulcatus]
MAAPIDEVEEDACVNPFSFQRFVSGQNAIDHTQAPAKGRSRLSPTTAGSLRLMDASTVTVECERVSEQRPDAIGQCSPEPVPCWDRRDVELPDPTEKHMFLRAQKLHQQGLTDLAGALGFAGDDGKTEEKRITVTKRRLEDWWGRGKLGLPPGWLRPKVSTLSPSGSGAGVTPTRFDQRKIGDPLGGGKRRGLEEENARLKRQCLEALETNRLQLARLEALEEEQEAQRHKEREETAALEQVVRQVECSLKAALARCRQLETDSHSYLSQATTDISAKLRTAADDAEMSLRSLLKGVDQLRLYSSLVASLSKVQEEVS